MVPEGGRGMVPEGGGYGPRGGMVNPLGRGGLSMVPGVWHYPL